MPSIRRYSPKDHEPCSDCMRSNIPVFFAPEEGKAFEGWLKQLDTGQPAHPLASAEHFYVLEAEGKIVACGGQILSSVDNAIYLAWGMVHANYHRKGYGKHLLNFRLQEINKQYPEKVIKIATSQHVAQFYERHGFTCTKVEKAYYSPTIDRVEMSYLD